DRWWCLLQAPPAAEEDRGETAGGPASMPVATPRGCLPAKTKESIPPRQRGRQGTAQKKRIGIAWYVPCPTAKPALLFALLELQRGGARVTSIVFVSLCRCVTVSLTVKAWPGGTLRLQAAWPRPARSWYVAPDGDHQRQGPSALQGPWTVG